MAIFTSDNVTGACPEVMDALIKANSGFAPSYGNDKWSLNLKNKFSEIFWQSKDVPTETKIAPFAPSLPITCPVLKS